jgi:hypothetical protein
VLGPMSPSMSCADTPPRAPVPVVMAQRAGNAPIRVLPQRTVKLIAQGEQIDLVHRGDLSSAQIDLRQKEEKEARHALRRAVAANQRRNKSVKRKREEAKAAKAANAGKAPSHDAQGLRVRVSQSPSEPSGEDEENEPSPKRRRAKKGSPSADSSSDSGSNGEETEDEDTPPKRRGKVPLESLRGQKDHPRYPYYIKWLEGNPNYNALGQLVAQSEDEEEEKPKKAARGKAPRKKIQAPVREVERGFKGSALDGALRRAEAERLKAPAKPAAAGSA